MAEVEIYTTTFCPYCIRAKMLMDEKGVEYREINLNQNPDRRMEMISRSDGRWTVPQIFINGQGIGGCDEMYALEFNGELDGLLAAISQ